MERSKRPRLLILDIDGVLYDYDRDERVRVLAELLSCEAPAVDDALYASGIEDRADEGALTTEQYLSRRGQRARPHPRPGHLGAGPHRRHPRRMARELALARHAAELTTVVTLSNNSLLLKEEMPTVMPELVAIPGLRIHVAAELGALKPNPAVYRRLVDLYGMSPRRRGVRR